MVSIEWLPTIITAFATVVVALATIYYAYTNHKLWKSSGIEKLRPRREDELNSIITPLVSHCDAELNQISRGWYDFLKFELYLENIHKNNYKTIIFNDFIRGRKDLETAIAEHEQIVCSLIENYQNIQNTINTSDFQNNVNDLLEEFNQKHPKQRFSQEINSLSKNIINHIIRSTDIEDFFLSDPFKSFWKINRDYFLTKRKIRDVQIQLNNIEMLTSQLVVKNKLIIDSLLNILNDYSKKYGISLKRELKDFY